MLPDFLILGAAKCGTTSLFRVLRRHPQVFMPRRKELHFFDQNRHYRRGPCRYERCFPRARGSFRAVGEATPGYLCHPAAPGRIGAHLPAAKLLVLVRDPVQRAYSHYWQARRALVEPLTFAKAVELLSAALYEPGRRGYFSRGLYINYIDRYLEHFPVHQLLVLLFDDLVRDSPGFYRRCFEFLGVDGDFRCPEMERAHYEAFTWRNPLYRFLFERPALAARSPRALRRLACAGLRRRFTYPPMDEEIRRRLGEFYAEPNRRLARFLDGTLEGWTGWRGKGESESPLLAPAHV